MRSKARPDLAVLRNRKAPSGAFAPRIDDTRRMNDDACFLADIPHDRSQRTQFGLAQRDKARIINFDAVAIRRQSISPIATVDAVFGMSESISSSFSKLMVKRSNISFSPASR